MPPLNSMSPFETTFDCTNPNQHPDYASGQQHHGSFSLSALTNSNQASSQPQRKVVESTPSRFTPWLLSLAYPLGRFVLFPFYFKRVTVTGREHLPLAGPVILAPTHRSRWDAFVVPFAAGYHVTKRHLRYMVSADEVTGLQGWFIRRMGGFPINTNRPAIATLRHGVELLEQGEVMVIFPEGNIYRDPHVQPLKPGLARLAIQAETSHPNLGVKIVPISIRYSQPLVPWRSEVEVHIGKPIQVVDYCTDAPKQSAKALTNTLQTAMEELTAQSNPQN